MYGGHFVGGINDIRKHRGDNPIQDSPVKKSAIRLFNENSRLLAGNGSSIKLGPAVTHSTIDRCGVVRSLKLFRQAYSLYRSQEFLRVYNIKDNQRGEIVQSSHFNPSLFSGEI
jgi:hypothetical protein